MCNRGTERVQVLDTRPFLCYSIDQLIVHRSCPVAFAVKLDLDQLRGAIQDEYAEVAACPTRGYHFHVGRAHAERLGYDRADLDPLPDTVVESFAGLGN